MVLIINIVFSSKAAFEQADRALYRAKQQGCYNVKVFHSQWNEMGCFVGRN